MRIGIEWTSFEILLALELTYLVVEWILRRKLQ